RGRDLDVDQRRAALQLHHLHLHARDRLRARPGFHQLHRIGHVAVLHPVGVEHRRLVRDADVFDQLRDDLVVPPGTDVAVDPAGVHVAFRDRGCAIVAPAHVGLFPRVGTEYPGLRTAHAAMPAATAPRETAITGRERAVGGTETQPQTK